MAFGRQIAKQQIVGPRLSSLVGRRSDRHAVRNNLQIRIHGLDVTMAMRDVGEGGFAIVSDRPFKSGTEQRFVISVAEAGLSITIMARAVYSRPVSDESGEMHFVTGWAFASGQGAAEQSAVNVVIAAAIDG